MMEDSPYEPLDFPHVSYHGDEEHESSEPIAPKSPNSTIEPLSSPVSTSVTHNFPQFPKLYSREKFIPKPNQV